MIAVHAQENPIDLDVYTQSSAPHEFGFTICCTVMFTFKPSVCVLIADCKPVLQLRLPHPESLDVAIRETKSGVCKE